MANQATAREVQKMFGRYHDQALAAPVTVTKYGRPSVVILSATEYERSGSLTRQTLAVTELSDSDIRLSDRPYPKETSLPHLRPAVKAECRCRVLSRAWSSPMPICGAMSAAADEKRA
jgi:antitoxin (DNA-binding transcriptional repressor) of toxin-antitoxin stability system